MCSSIHRLAIPSECQRWIGMSKLLEQADCASTMELPLDYALLIPKQRMTGYRPSWQQNPPSCQPNIVHQGLSRWTALEREKRRVGPGTSMMLPDWIWLDQLKQFGTVPGRLGRALYCWVAVVKVASCCHKSEELWMELPKWWFPFAGDCDKYSSSAMIHTPKIMSSKKNWILPHTLH